MPEPKRIVIVGSGLAGATAAGSLRDRGYAGEVVLFGADPRYPYELPALSKGILTGEADEPDWVQQDGFYSANDIELRRGTSIARVELGARRVYDSKDDWYRYDRLLLATGSRPRELSVPGAELAGIRTLRTLEDAVSLRAAFGSVDRVVIIGAGWIGTEAAAAARGHGADVTVIDQNPRPLQGVLGETVAGVFHELHREHGVTWRLGSGVAGFSGTAHGVTGVRLTDGTELRADTVLLAVGAEPRTDLGHAAGLEIADDGGLSTDAGLRTSAPDVYAAGDIASQFHPGYGRRVRVEHWANAKNQGAHVAGNLLGAQRPYERSPYFFSDQYDLGCEYRGLADPETDRLVVRGDLASREFTAFWLREGRVQAAMNVNMWDDGDALGRLVDGRVAVSEEALRTGNLASIG